MQQPQGPNGARRAAAGITRLFVIMALGGGAGQLKAQELFACWPFDDLTHAVTLEAVSKTKDQLLGYFDPAPGVSHGAIQFDGFTSCLQRAPFGRDLPRQFTINAWVALESYPWFRCPVFDLRRGAQDGVLLAVNHAGCLAAALGTPAAWAEVPGPKLPLKEWLMLSLSVAQGGPAQLYLNGRRVGGLPAAPALGATRDHAFTIGRNTMLEPWPDYQYIVTNTYAFLDGRVDDVGLYGTALGAEQIRQLYAARRPLPKVQSAPRVLPAGPPGPAEFGACYTRLNYTRQWERLWRVGADADILVRFADQDCRLVFWRGTSQVPCWVTENGIWYTDEWTETWGRDVVSCAEPLMDRQCRFSHVRIIEHTPARVIVHWRYALVDTEYHFVGRDVDGRGEWTDEYYITYPDMIGIRRIDLHYSKPLRRHDWEEAIILLSPGQHPDEVIRDPEVTLVNMAGETHAYSWRHDLPVEMKEPPGANMHMVNLRSAYKPFYIVTPEPFESAEGKYASPFFRSYSAAQGAKYHPPTVPSVYGWWNHWPVTPVPGDGRWVINNDQPSHFNLTTYTQWKDYHMDERVKTRIMLRGLTRRRPAELVPLARSWLQPPRLEPAAGAARYEAAERAYLVTGLGPAGLDGRLRADREHPAVHPAVVLYGLRLERPVVRLDGQALTPGQDFQHGTVRELEQWKTLVWLNREITRETRIEISK